MHEANDSVVQAASGASPVEVLHAQCVELAVEAAALRFDRIRASRGTKDVGRLISRRIRALRSVADAIVQLHALSVGTPSPTAIRQVLQLLTDDVLAASREVLDAPTADRLAEAVHRRVAPLIDELAADKR